MEFLVKNMFCKLDELEMARHEAELHNLVDEEENLESKIKDLLLDLDILLESADMLQEDAS